MRFPWRVYIRFVVLQTSLLTAILTCLSFLSVWLLGGPQASFKYLILFFFADLLCAFILTLWIGRKFFLPLGRLVEKARSLRARKALLGNEDPDSEEWDVLEHAIDQFQVDLKQTSDRLSEGREEIKALMSAISDAIVAFDHQGRTLFYNERFAHTFLPLAEHGRDVHLVDLFRDSVVRQAFSEALQSGEPVNVSAALTAVGESDPRDFQLAVAPLRRPRERAEIYGVIAIFHDVSDLKQAERIRIEFVGNASHELRTPLTSVKGYLSTLQSDLTQGRLQDAEKFLNVISRNVDRLIALVNDLLDLSSLESHSQTLDLGLVSTREVTEAVLKTLEREAFAKEQTLKMAIQHDSVYCDVRKVEQVITNLVANAIKYIPTGKAIQVIWDRADDGGSILRVIDDGPGIPKKHLSRLFERFYRVDEGRARDAGGTGLGLAIVKHIMLSHNGSVKVNSEVGKGTEFVCHFPPGKASAVTRRTP